MAYVILSCYLILGFVYKCENLCCFHIQGMKTFPTVNSTVTLESILVCGVLKYTV